MTWRRRLIQIALRLSQAAAVLVVAAPLAFRVGAGVLPAFALLALGVLAAGAALVLAPVGWMLSRTDADAAGRTRPARLAVVIAIAVLAVPVFTVVTAAGAPPIHHITTDPDDPPHFDAVVALRGANSNPLEYPGPELAAVQREAYPDIQPVHVDLPPPEAFARSVQVARELGWAIVDASVSEGRIEATDTTRWFGFADDVVVRIQPEDGGSRIDLRSVSRVGGGDLGANARRIRRFTSRLEATGNQD